jgi:hypothetical protein
MVIDFPEAGPDTPTQCIALAVDSAYVGNILHYLNEYYNSTADEGAKNIYADLSLKEHLTERIPMDTKNQKASPRRLPHRYSLLRLLTGFASAALML